MLRVVTAAPLAEFHSADANTIQDNAFGIAQAAGLIISNWTVRGAGTTILFDGVLGVPFGANAVLSMINGGLVSVSLASTGWNYLYLENISGTLTLFQSTTAPSVASGYTLMTGDATKVYVTCFYVSPSTGAMSPFYRTKGGRYLYDFPAIAPANAPWHFLLSATSYTSLDISGAIPPHVGLADCMALVTNTNTTTICEAQFANLGSTTAPINLLTAQAPTTGTSIMYGSLSFPMALEGGPAHIKYQLSFAPSSATLDVLGFTE